MNEFSMNDFIINEEGQILNEITGLVKKDEIPKEFQELVIKAIELAKKDVEDGSRAVSNTLNVGVSEIFFRKANNVVKEKIKSSYRFAIPKKITAGMYAFTPKKWIKTSENMFKKLGMTKSNHPAASGSIKNVKITADLYYKVSKDKKFIYTAMIQTAPWIIKDNIIFDFYCYYNTNDGKGASRFINGMKSKNENAILMEKSETIDAWKDYANNHDRLMKVAQGGLLIDTDSYEAFFRYPEFNNCIKEHMDLKDPTTKNILFSLREEGQSALLTSLTSKLYDNIVEKIDDIDYGTIPKSKGDITKVENYYKLKDCIEILTKLVKEFKQDTGPVEVLSLALANLETRKDLFTRAFNYKSELPMVMYNNMVLALFSGVSYMIAVSVEFIKSPTDEAFSIVLDKVSYAKTKDHLIYSNLDKFNKACAKGDFDKSMEYILQKRVKNFAGALTIGGGIAALGLILLIIPLLREVVFFFYYARTRLADFFDIQADLLMMNAYNLQNNETGDVDKKSEISKKQLKISDRFRKVANFFAIDGKKAEVEAVKDVSNSKEKYKIEDVKIDPEIANSGSVSTLF